MEIMETDKRRQVGDRKRCFKNNLYFRAVNVREEQKADEKIFIYSSKNEFVQKFGRGEIESYETMVEQLKELLRKYGVDENEYFGKEYVEERNVNIRGFYDIDVNN